MISNTSQPASARRTQAALRKPCGVLVAKRLLRIGQPEPDADEIQELKRRLAALEKIVGKEA
ncbi:hypothetical protein [Mesorhizobium sp.]|uniref:hypothetical protein n=1 Tax=Mesorhizobium sp. TaxID=1871066 RepID=UPI0025D7030F|nr:hypothetical protein [Mesorhizobium sp.]